MPTYTIEQYELHVSKYTIEAKDKAEAIKKILEGEGTLVDNSLEYICTDETRGMDAFKLEPKIINELISLDVNIDENGHVPSIRSINEVD